MSRIYTNNKIMNIQENEMQIFVTDYASYNEGTQFKHGHWLDLTQFSSVDELQDHLTKHFESVGIEDPEIMITDFEGFPKKFYSESFSTSLMTELFEYLELLNNCHNPKALAAYVEYGCDANDFDEAFSGEFDSDEDFAQNLAEETGAMDNKPQWPYTCIDWEWAAREVMYDYFEVDGFYFRSL